MSARGICIRVGNYRCVHIAHYGRDIQISRIAGYFKKAQMDDQFVIALCYDKKMEYCSVVNSYFLCEGEYILRVISKDEAIILWEKLNNEFKFKPGTDIPGEMKL